MSLYSEYRRSLKMPEVEEVLDLFLYRPLAFILVKSIYSTNITPNMLTLTSILVSIVAGCFYAVGTAEYVTYGALLFLAHLIIDCSDGQLARLKKNGTHAGRIIDGVGDFFSTLAVFIGLGIGYQIHNYDPLIWWSLLIVTMLSNGIQSVLVDYYGSRFLDYVLQRKSTFEEDLDSFKEEYEKIKELKGRRVDKFIISAYIKYSALQSRLSGKRVDEKLFVATPQDYYKKNVIAMRMWLFIGPTTQVSALIFCSLINRFDIFFWLMIVGFNSIALLMWLIQRKIDKTFKPITK